MILIIMYANFEEEFGLINNTMKIFDKFLCLAPSPFDETTQLNLVNLYLARATKYYGFS